MSAAAVIENFENLKSFVTACPCFKLASFKNYFDVVDTQTM